MAQWRAMLRQPALELATFPRSLASRTSPRAAFPPSVHVPEGGSPDAKSTNSNADGFVLWPLQHAGRASGSSEWLGCRLGGQGDLAARNDLLSASLSSSSLSSLSSLSLVIGLLCVFSSRGRRLQAGGLVLRRDGEKPGPNGCPGFYSPRRSTLAAHLLFLASLCCK